MNSNQLKNFLERYNTIVHISFFALAIILTGTILAVNVQFYHDDAYITLRYARNLIIGNGVVWNPGERVQGYTNFLHMILISSIGQYGVDLRIASRIIGFVSFGALVLTAILYAKVFMAKRVPVNPWQIPVLLVVTSTPLLVWTLGGLEGTLFSLFIAGGCILYLATLDSETKQLFFAGSGFCFGMAYLVRPDGLLLVGVTLVWLTRQLMLKRQTIKDIVTFIVPVIIIIVPYIAWQISYYGDFIPNTFYVKAESFSIEKIFTGLRYLFYFLFQPPFLLLLSVTLTVCVWLLKKIDTKLKYLIMILAAYIAFIMYVGGDHMQSFRLFLPLIVPMSLIIYYSLIYLFGTDIRFSVYLPMLIVLLLSYGQLMSVRLNPQMEDRASRFGTVVGKFISHAWPKGSLVALNTAGSTPYFAPMHTYIDMLGLNDKHIAKRRVDSVKTWGQHLPGHLKGDGKYVLSKKPDYIIIGPADGGEAPWSWFLSDREIVRDSQFISQYQKHSVILNQKGDSVAEDGFTFTFYKRIDVQ